MLKYYIKITLRRFKNDKFFSILNTTGLATGVACFILLAVYLRHELSFDKFHHEVDDVYVLAKMANTHNGVIPIERVLMGRSVLLKEQVPEMAVTTQVSIIGYENLITIGERQFYEEAVFATDNEFFEVFDFPLIDGVPQFHEPGKALLSESLAQKYFPEENPIGRILNIRDGGDFEITGIVADAPSNSRIQYEILVSNFDLLEIARPEAARPGGGSVAQNYVRLPKGTDPEALVPKLENLLEETLPREAFYVNEQGEINHDYFFFPFKDSHLKSGFEWSFFPPSDYRYVILFGSIGILILVIACLNYINLVTARSAKKLKEIGLRKVIGGESRQLRHQIFAEAIGISVLSVFIAFALAERLLPYFNDIVQRELTLSYWSAEFVVFTVALSLIIGFLSGAYPAYRLSRFNPVQALSGNGRIREKKGLRRGLVFFQFFIAQALIVGTIIIQSQLSYLQNKDLGYDREHAVFLDTHDEGLGEKGQVLKNELEKLPGVKSVAFSDNVFRKNAITFMGPEKFEGFDGDKSEWQPIEYFLVDTAFMHTMGFRIVEGVADANSNRTIIINESLQKMLGYKDPIGKVVDFWGNNLPVTAVMADFNNESLKTSVLPAMFIVTSKPMRFLNLRLHPGELKGTIDEMSEIWDRLVAEGPLPIEFYDLYYEKQYESETRLGTIFNVFSTLAIVISVLGLVGLVVFAIEQRIKEFSIRKVLGAKVRQLMMLVYKEFVWLILLAFLLATPLAWYGLDDWLKAFAYRISLGPATFILALGITLFIATLVVVQVSGRVSKLNPADTLKNE